MISTDMISQFKNDSIDSFEILSIHSNLHKYIFHGNCFAYNLVLPTSIVLNWAYALKTSFNFGTKVVNICIVGMGRISIFFTCLQTVSIMRYSYKATIFENDLCWKTYFLNSLQQYGPKKYFIRSNKESMYFWWA